MMDRLVLESNPLVSCNTIPQNREQSGSSAAISPSQVDMLILGAGWTSTFLIPTLEQEEIKYAATTTTGRDHTLKFKFEYDDSREPGYKDDIKPYEQLPLARTILITFPLRGKKPLQHLKGLYEKVHGSNGQFILLGSSGIWQIPDQDLWVTRNTKYDIDSPRAQAEDELIRQGGCALNLSGLWGDQRQPKNWVDRVAPTKEKLAEKTSLHLIHGEDVARGIVACHKKWEAAKGQRFMLTDLIVYDWWELVLGFAADALKVNAKDEKASKQFSWVQELMSEKDVRALPRSKHQLGRCYDSRDFWEIFNISPIKARVH